jgi:hypothetical protein
MLKSLSLASLAVVFIYSMPAVPAQAQNSRSFVSSQGSDANPCTLAAPCRSFQAAHNATNAGGEISVLDSAGYGTLTITKSISIVSPGGVYGGITTPPGVNAITINAGANDVVSLRGLTLNGSGTGGNGIYFTAGAKLAVTDCVISNYAEYGILVKVSAATDKIGIRVLITNTTVSDTVGGIELATFSSGVITATFGGLTLDNNTDSIQLLAEGGPIFFMMANSQIGANSQLGIYSIAQPLTPNLIQLKNVTFTNMPYDIYLAGNSQLNISQVTELYNLRVNGFYCTGNSNYIISDGTNQLSYVVGSTCSLQFQSPQ